MIARNDLNLLMSKMDRISDVLYLLTRKPMEVADTEFRRQVYMPLKEVIALSENIESKLSIGEQKS